MAKKKKQPNKQQVAIETSLVSISRDLKRDRGAVNPPIYQTSTILFPTWEDYVSACDGDSCYEGYASFDPSYALGGTPTTAAFTDALKQLEAADHGVVTSSGLSAITTALLSFVKAGDHILVTDTAYGPTRRFCNQVLKRLGVETTYYEPRIGTGIVDLIQPNTRVVYLESPGSLTFELQDIPAIVEAVRHTREDIILIADNSWASPLYYQPIALGVDVSIQAITKFIGGHSDVVMGAILYQESVRKPIESTIRALGEGVSPTACYYALRGLRTLAARMQIHQANAAKVLAWLEKQSIVQEILAPELPSHPDHAIWRRDFTGSGSLFTLVLDKPYPKKQVAKAINQLKLFGIGASWGGYESLVMYFDPKSVRTHKKHYSGNTHIRLFIGLENPDDLIRDIDTFFKNLKK